MGYTHYWDTKQCTEEDEAGLRSALPVVRDILQRHRKAVCLEHNLPKQKAYVSEEKIQFNGKGEDGHETFLFMLNDSWEFCKTARKPYDIAVCEVLLVLNAYLPNMSISSDGFCGLLAEQENGVVFDGTWNQAIENIKQYGIEYTGRISRKRPPYCT